MKQRGISRNLILIEQTNTCPDVEPVHFLKDNQRPQRDEQDDQNVLEKMRMDQHSRIKPY